MDEPKEIIVRMPNWIGDLVMSTPILTDLRSHFPNARITAMVCSGLAPLLEHDRDVDEVFSFSNPSGWLQREERRDVIGHLREGRYDLGLLLTGSFSSAWYFWRGRVRRRIGFTGDGRSILLSDPVKWPEGTQEQHLVKTYKSLLAPLAIPISSSDPRLYVLDKELDEARQMLVVQGVKEGQRVIGINPGAAFGSAKCWLPDRFRKVAERLIEDRHNTVVFVGDLNSSALVKKICFGLPSTRVINLCGATSLRQFVAITQLFDVLLTNDSGPMHVASALGVPLVALFGSTSDVKTGPYRGGRVIHKHVSCSPCYERVCPIDFRCMKQIGVDEVYDSLLDLLGEGPGGV